ncbi:MAG TPA: hypothetical protein VG714_03210 [Acidobacteriaceae bacterium]|nr:hypothetical protein [Acidobacteriaceae bacterium]
MANNSLSETDPLRYLYPAASTSRRDFLRVAGLATAGATIAPGGFAGMVSKLVPESDHAAMQAASAGVTKILVAADAHPAIQSASKILAKRLKLDESAIATYEGVPKAARGAIVLALAKDGRLPAIDAPKRDGYTVTYTGGIVVWGARPRSVLFAAGEPHHWAVARTAAYHRAPEFALRNATWHPDYPVADQAAIFGANFFIANLPGSPALQNVPDVFNALSAADQKSLADAGRRHKEENAARVKEFRDADVEVYALLPYGVNFETWAPALYAATCKVYPSAKGTPMPNSHESAALCPSDPLTWKVLDEYVREWAEQTGADGISATFWDNYSAFCQDPRCKADGLDKFPNELQAFISHYYTVLKPMGMKLHMRTWSSGCPHWLGPNYVHAPGYGQFGMSHPELWSQVIKNTPAEIIMQTKIYHSDCEPNARFTTLLGHCKPHIEMVEYQQVGQFIGRQYFPASTVNYTAETMKKALALTGPDGGVQMHAGGTNQPASFDIFADILNSNCIYAWRELTWNINVDLATMWHEWATDVYGAAAAPAMVRFMRASEDACTWCWCPLGHGSSTNADFAGNIARRETLLRYTNRYYLPEFAAYLEPTLENIDRMVKQKADCMGRIDEMAAAFAEAKPHLTEAQASEIATRFDWFRHFAVCNTTLDLSLWRFRYLRALAAKLTTDPKQMKELAEAYDLIEAEAPKLFQYDPSQKLSMYRVTLGELGKPGQRGSRAPALGNPRSLMHELYNESLRFVEESVGPDYLPKEWVKSNPMIDIPSTEQRPGGQRGTGGRRGGGRGAAAPAAAS